MDNHETLSKGGAAVELRLPHHHCRGQFPAKLYALLELSDLSAGGGARFGVGWLPTGRAFRVSDASAFMEKAAPLFFRQTKFRSFCRQLNLWGFRRIPRGVDAGAWYHEHFLRDDPDEMSKMFRTIVKGTKNNKPPPGKDEDDAAPPPLLPAPASTEGPSAPSGEGTSGNDDRGGGVRGRRRVSLEASSSHPIAALALLRSDDDVPPRRAEAPPRLLRLSSPRPVVSPMPSPVGSIRGHRDADVRPRPRQRGGTAGAPSDDAFLRTFQRLMGERVGEMVPLPFGGGEMVPLPSFAPAPGTALVGGIQGGSTAGPAPLPFSGISSEGGSFPFEGRAEGPSAAAGLEPLPFEAEPPLDELAGYIDRVIQMV